MPRLRELNHLFVNNVRFWSILSIIAIHSAGVFAVVDSNQDLGFALLAPFKFATIGFFLISGFLMGERVDRRDPLAYLMRRFKKVFIPWSFWFGTMCVLLVIREFIFRPGSNALENLHIAYVTSRATLLDTSFWFVPNLLLSIAILLMCRRYLYSLKLGFVLCLFNLVYVVNIYASWFTTLHTQALFGFVFYLWLGSYAAHNFERMSRFLAKIPTAALVAGSAITGAAAYGESHLLFVLHSADPLNTLRLSNQAFSIFVVLMIFKFRRATWPAFIDVRRHTFGLYLSHLAFVMLLGRTLRHFPRWAPDSIYVSAIEGVVLWVALSVTAYVCCLLLTRWLASRPSLQWMVGLVSEDSTGTARFEMFEMPAPLSFRSRMLVC